MTDSDDGPGVTTIETSDGRIVTLDADGGVLSNVKPGAPPQVRRDTLGRVIHTSRRGPKPKQEDKEVRLDTLGRAIHDSRRGPVPKRAHPEAGRTTGYVSVRLPVDMLEELNGRARAHEETYGKARRGGSGRSGIVRDALSLLFYGDAHKWRLRFLAERTARLQVEEKLARAREALE